VILAATAVAAGVAFGIAGVALGCAEAFRRRMLMPAEVPAVPVTLVMPVTGPLPGFDGLLAALARQSLRPHRLIVGIESAADPAYRRVVAAATAHPSLHIEPVLAGLCDARAQKCTNLIAALSRLGPDDRYVVLLDADIRPQTWWLAALVAPLAGGRADIVNGYRWQAPAVASLAGALGSAIDRAIATLPRLDITRLLWGGSLALTPNALAVLDPPATLARALTEDLVLADRAAALRLRIVTRRAIRVPTPLDPGLLRLWRFARRQYQIIHAYRPYLWRFAAAVTAADLAARAGLMTAAALAGGLAQRLAIVALIGLGALGSAALEARRAIGRRLGVVDPAGLRLAQHLLVWLYLPTAAFHAIAVAAACRYAVVTWSHVRYRVARGGRILAAARSPYPG
jgi:hypothetical protein